MMKQLIAGITTLTSTVASLVDVTSRRDRARSPSRSSGPRRTRDRSATPTPSNPDTLCWYHRKFGSSARSCQSPCTWSSQPGNGQ